MSVSCTLTQMFYVCQCCGLALIVSFLTYLLVFLNVLFNDAVSYDYLASAIK